MGGLRSIGSPFGVKLSNSVIFQSMALGLTVWWGLLPEHIIWPPEILSIFDSDCLNQDSVPALIEPVFEPLDRAKTLKHCLNECNKAMQSEVYKGVGSTVFGGALLLACLLSNSN
jgi:hypothetical protein